nr:hypothetical protein [Tanacetum cinerariifolium]
MFLIASRFPTLPLACAFFNPGATVNYRLNPRYAIKECLSCGALYTGDFCCSKRNVEDKIHVPKLPKNCVRSGYIFSRLPNTSKSSDDSTNVVNAPREPFVVKQDHDVNPSHIDECCCECGDVLDGIFCQQCTWDHMKPSSVNQRMKIITMSKILAIILILLVLTIVNPRNIPSIIRSLMLIPACYDDDDDYNSAITPVLSTEERDNSLSILDTMCDVHLVNNPTPLEAKDHFEIVIKSNDDISSSDDDSLYNENIEYVKASPHDSDVVSLEVAEIVISEDEEIEDDNLREKLLNVHFLIANIEALKDNPTPSSEFLTKSSSTSPKSFLEETNTFDNSLLEFKNYYFDLEEISSGSTTTHSDISLSDYEALYFDDDHIEEISNGNTTTHSDISLSEYDSFIFDFLNDQFPLTDRSDFTHEEFSDELAHIISPPEYVVSTLGICPIRLSSILRNLKTLAKGFYHPSLKFLSFNWESNKNEKRGKTQQCRRPITVEKEEKEKKYKFKGQNMQIQEVYLIQVKRQGLNVPFAQSNITRVKAAKLLKLLWKGAMDAITSNTLEGLFYHF